MPGVCWLLSNRSQQMFPSRPEFLGWFMSGEESKTGAARHFIYSWNMVCTHSIPRIAVSLQWSLEVLRDPLWNDIHTIGVKTVDVARHGARFAVSKHLPREWLFRLDTINHNISSPLPLLSQLITQSLTPTNSTDNNNLLKFYYHSWLSTYKWNVLLPFCINRWCYYYPTSMAFECCLKS